MTVLPHPDSPTSPSTSPRRMSNETPSTARRNPAGVSNPALNPSTLSKTSLMEAHHPMLPSSWQAFWGWRSPILHGMVPAMKVERLMEIPGTECLRPAPADTEISAAFTSDLLSDVMAEARP